MAASDAVEFCLATPAGLGGVSVVWLRGGEGALCALDACVCGSPYPASRSGWICYGFLRAGGAGDAVDEVLLAKPGPGRRILSGHGGVAATRAVLDFLEAEGYRRRASGGDWAADFLGPEGTDAEAAAAEALLPAAATEAQAAALLGVRAGTVPLAAARDLLRPRRCVLIGPYQSGKSSLFNRLVGSERALVTDWAGATLDPVVERTALSGLTVDWVDTPGLPVAGGRSPESGDDPTLWAAAWEKACAHLQAADAVIVVSDARRGWSEAESGALATAWARVPPGAVFLAAPNFSDLLAETGGASALPEPENRWSGVYPIHPPRGDGVGDLRRALAWRLGAPEAVADGATGWTFAG